MLLAENGPFPGLRHELTEDAIVIGRHPQCGVVVDVGAVSRRHAQITVVDGQHLIEDLRSRNGTFVNNQLLVGRRRLREGDRIRICDTTYIFHENEATVPPEGSVQADDGSSFAAVLLDDERGNSTIMSKVDVTSTTGRVKVTSSADVKLHALLEINKRLGRALALDEVLPEVLNSLFKIFMQADRGFIVLRTDDGDLRPKWTKLRRDEDDDTIRISRTIVRRVMESKEAVLSADAVNDDRFDMSESIADLRVRSMMCAPLVDSDGEAFGVLQIDTVDHRHRFQEDDLEVLVSVAAQAAIAINNAQLHEAALNQQVVDRDLELAHRVQRGFLPANPPELVDYEFFNFYQAANMVGGDYYDYVHLPDGRIAVIVADVVGHGIAAALLMAKFSADVRFSLASELHPATAVRRLNTEFQRAKLDDRFVTFVMVVLNPETHVATIVNAGHMPPIWRRSVGSVEDAAEEIAGLPLGVVDHYEYGQHEVTIGPGELLVLYTDGINEAQNDRGQLYTIERLRRQVAATDENADAVGKGIMHDVNLFVGDLPQGDDMCLVCISRANEQLELTAESETGELSEEEKSSATGIF
jgi:sigma-B regulation protein RsbU (phosphoserine phosphatase)